MSDRMITKTEDLLNWHKHQADEHRRKADNNRKFSDVVVSESASQRQQKCEAKADLYEDIASFHDSAVTILLEGLRSESAGPTERQVYQWFQESTIAHHIEEDGHHISKRSMFIAKKAWECALKSDAKSKPDSWYDVEVIDALVRRLDVAINGEKGAARQAMLCDLVAQLEVEELPPSATANEPILGYKHTMFMEGGQTQVRLTESGVNPFGVGGKDYSKEYNVISIPLSLHKDSVGTKPQRITKQDVMTIAWSASFSLGVKYGRDLHEALKKWWEWEDTGDTLLARLNERREPEQREIPVNDPIFHFVAQHYPLTAQVVERIYRECIHHCESREG